MRELGACCAVVLCSGGGDWHKHVQGAKRKEKNSVSASKPVMDHLAINRSRLLCYYWVWPEERAPEKLICSLLGSMPEHWQNSFLPPESHTRSLFIIMQCFSFCVPSCLCHLSSAAAATLPIAWLTSARVCTVSMRSQFVSFPFPSNTGTITYAWCKWTHKQTAHFPKQSNQQQIWWASSSASSSRAKQTKQRAL